MICSKSCGDFELEKDWFWIDSICINQNDIDERESQVKLMGQIYRQAAKTVVWLAEATEDTDQAIEFLSQLAERRPDLRRDVKKYGKRMPRALEGHIGWKSLERLLSLPWWRRVWTLQEFVLARHLRFYCGTKSICRPEFRRGMMAVELCSPLDKHIESRVWHTAWNRRRLMQWYEDDQRKENMSLVSLMAFCGDYQATDPRDRIWALYGLLREEDRQMMGYPTYGSDVKSLYTSLVKACVDTYGSLDIICYAQPFRGHDPDWPSWVPDWRVNVQPLRVSLMVSQSANETLANFRPRGGRNKPEKHVVKPVILFKAAGGQPPIPQAWDIPSHLTCRGYVIDYIDGLGGLGRSDAAQIVETTSPVNTITASPQHIRELRDSLARTLVLNRRDQYLDRPAPVQRYNSELLQVAAACRDKEAGKGPAPPWVVHWWRNNGDLRIRGSTIREICHSEGCDSSVLETEKSMFRNPKGFFPRMRGVTMGDLRRLMVTDEGHVGMAPVRARKGDVVCVLFGCSVPVALREREGRGADGRVYELIGECYLDGFMDGEALGMGKQTHDFRIQ
ncbi:hypothetical protein VPNG_07397 [Cytospora leucostoma]|uniref:Heterokaryon incompatibility domain-containing protein n=1 Tax=Cytospora leucostoma TaxID=1230097 RepID=A0A423WMG7_9PEZI|nr:hypothetical protein VPNG_07397 [Cytospora leucostoma]